MSTPVSACMEGGSPATWVIIRHLINFQKLKSDRAWYLPGCWPVGFYPAGRLPGEQSHGFVSGDLPPDKGFGRGEKDHNDDHLSRQVWQDLEDHRHKSSVAVVLVSFRLHPHTLSLVEKVVVKINIILGIWFNTHYIQHYVILAILEWCHLNHLYHKVRRVTSARPRASAAPASAAPTSRILSAAPWTFWFILKAI